MENILKFKDICDTRLIEEKYANKYSNIDIDDFLNTIDDDADIINSIWEKIIDNQDCVADENLCVDLINLREMYEKHKQMYLNLNLDFDDDNKEELLFIISCIYDRALAYIEDIDNIILIDSNDIPLRSS